MKKQAEKYSTGVFYNLANLLHKSSKTHPQNPQRLTILIDSLKELNENIKKFEMREVIEDEGKLSKQKAQALLVETHGQSYWEFVKQMWHQEIQKSQMYINIDTYFMKDTYIAALQAARTTLIAVDALAEGEYQSCFSIVRPPGHHSGFKNQPHGFSFFNNISLAANHLIQNKKAKKIAIIDWDVHHGEGTQKIFYNRNDILFISLHRYDQGKFFPHIPQSGSNFVGGGIGTGFNINICWNLEQKPKGYQYQREQTCGDEEYFYAFNRIVMPVLTEFEPEMILISCGFDSAFGDPIGSLYISKAGYTMMLQQLMSLKNKTLLVLQGGYNKQVLKWAGQAIVRTLVGQIEEETQQNIQKLKSGQPNSIGKKGVEEALNNISKYWTKL